MRPLIKVLIVDDSVVYRSQIRAALASIPFVEVVGVAHNGKVALERLTQINVDLMILDLEMPEMTGLETLEAMKAKNLTKTKVLLFSSHSKRGAEITMDALRLGASDFVPKPGSDPGFGATMGVPTGEIVDPAKRIHDLMLPKIEALFPASFQETKSGVESIRVTTPAASALGSDASRKYPKIIWETIRPSVVVIGSSTGGPTILEKLFSSINGPLNCPILVAQHMPPIFTATLAERLKTVSGIEVREAKHGELLRSNTVYVAPGNYHMVLDSLASGVCISLNQGPQENFVRPAVDPLFRSAAEIFKTKCLAFVMTGMGSDGRLGAVAVKEAGGAVVIQNEASCVVFGMPGAVRASGAFDLESTPEAIIELLISKVAPQSRSAVGSTGKAGGF